MRELLNTKWISNRKQVVRKETEPYGHNFEAVAYFKQYYDVKDSFYIYKMNDTRGNPDILSWTIAFSECHFHHVVFQRKHVNATFNCP